MNIKPVKTKKDYEEALKRIDAIFDSKTGTPEFDELELLSILVEKYEEEHYPISKPDPVETIKFYMDQNDLNRKDLVEYIGSISKVSEILNKKRPLSINMIRALNKGLGIPVDLLFEEYPLDSKSA